MRLAYYAGASTAAAAACLFKAFHERPNFYSATVYLSQSNACLLILTNLLLVFACSFMYALQRLLYGPLRPIEIEHLSEKAWYAVLDTLLAMPSFRDDVGGWLLAMFVLLLAGKVWGWIGEGKVEVLEQQPPANPRLFHARLATSLITSVIFDMWMLDYCVETVLADPRPGMMVIFTFEFAILSISSTFTLSRYLLSVIQTRIEKQQLQKAVEDRKEEIRAERAAARQNETADGQPTQAAPPNEEPIEVDENEVDAPAWEEKRRYLFFLEVLTDFIKLMIYIVFFTVSITFNGLPMHIMRDVYMTFASFSKRVTAYVAYRKATSDMNTQYPDATTEEISGDACIVCRDTMVAWEQPRAQDQAQPAAQQGQAAPAPRRRRDEGLRAKKLPCGHILHLRCLKSWLERQQVCPTCRRSVVVPTASTQPGAGGVNPAAPGQQGQQGAQAAQRQGRARILNFGPIRIGFLNGPGDQIGNLIRQMQNQQPAAGQDRAQAGNQRGPNHLGLQVPYLGGQQQNGAANAASTQMQIAQIQQRIVQDAQNLGLQQQQLITLQAMEHELERLRMLQQGPQNSIPVAQAAMPQAIPPLPMPPYSDVGPGAIPFQLPMPGQQHSSSQSATALRGNINEELTNGDINLPLGFSIPEGWTLMPLRPANAADAQQSSRQTSATQGPQASPLESTDAAINAANDLNNATSATEQSAVGPTDDNGSPYFEPTVPSTNGMAPPVTEESVARHPQRTTSLSGTQAQAYQRAPWTSGDWSFADASKTSTDPSGGERDPEAAEESVSEPANGSLPEKDASTYSGKGKGKAAEIEDAPDSGT